ncbi:hypothetical protein [Endozoicomonas sp. ONNA2]|uniref:coiled-coil domain-containing protein n=1 Tax=Endozoicomonas sp. ONNA2 TaxID=2828741 RepID=UPI002149880B|nr:hypothetical protein [Endozoicomonas sp. ONNA2]
MPQGIEGQRPVGVNSSSESGTVKPAEESHNATHRGTPVSRVGKVAKKSRAPQDEVGEKTDTPIQNRDIKKTDGTGPSGRNSAARQRRREKIRAAGGLKLDSFVAEDMKIAPSAADHKNQGIKTSEELASIAEDSGISEDESIAGPPHSPGVNHWVKEYDSGIEDDVSSFNGRTTQEQEPAMSATGVDARDLPEGQPLPTRPESTKSLKKPPKKTAKKRRQKRSELGIDDKGGASQRANSDPEGQTFHPPKYNKLLKESKSLARDVEKVDENQGKQQSDYLAELDRLKAVYAENIHDDDRKIEHYLASDKAFTDISKGKKRLKQELKPKPLKDGVKWVHQGAGKTFQEFIDRAIHQKRPLHPVRRPQKTPETASVKDSVTDPVLAKVEGDYNGTEELVKNLQSEVPSSPAWQYVAAKKVFREELENTGLAKDLMEETHRLQQQIQTVKATVFERLEILDHVDRAPLADPYITNRAYVSALEAAFDTIGMEPSEAREHLANHPAMKKHLEGMRYREEQEPPECLAYLNKLDEMEHLNDKAYLEKLKDLENPRFKRGFSDGFRLKWLAKHLSQTFRRYSEKTVLHQAFRDNMKDLLDTLNTREHNIGCKLKSSADSYKEQCSKLRKAKDHLKQKLADYQESGEGGIDIRKQKEVLANAKDLMDSMKPVYEQIKLVTSYPDPQMECAWREKQCSDLDKQHESVQKSIQECQKKLDKAKSKGKLIADIQNKMKTLQTELTTINQKSTKLKEEYKEFRIALNRYYRIKLDMDIKLVTGYANPKQECDALKKQYATEDKQHASVQKLIKKCREKLEKAERKGGELENFQKELAELESQSANHEKNSAKFKSDYAQLSQALKRLDTIQLDLNNQQPDTGDDQ